jgi:hypothetical protein
MAPTKPPRKDGMLPTQSLNAVKFNLEHLSVVHQSLRNAEELVSQFFRIPALPSKQYPYEVVTLSDLEDCERALQALAHLVVYERERPNNIKEYLYRICLQDDMILLHLQEAEPKSLKMLLSYILTHELVHIVRFQRAEQSFLIRDHWREKEEDIVHQITLDLFKGTKEPLWERLESLYGNPVFPAHVFHQPLDSSLLHRKANLF